MLTLSTIQEAAARLQPYIHRTPSVKNSTLSAQFNTNVYLKLELFQKTGSFKIRAAFNKMLRLSPEQQKRGVVAVSGGNFAQAVAYAGTVLNIPTTILMPSHTPQNYVDATQAYGGKIELFPDIKTAFEHADQYQREGLAQLHPFDDPDIMAGNGTIGLELLEDIPELTDVVVSVGGGGLMSGVTVALKSLKPSIRIWSVETEGADVLARALITGEIVHIQPTSLAKTLGAPYTTAEIVARHQHYGLRHLLLPDEEAYQAQRFLMERAKIVPELAAACTLAAVHYMQAELGPQNHLALIICGGNVSLADLVNYYQRFEV